VAGRTLFEALRLDAPTLCLSPKADPVGVAGLDNRTLTLWHECRARWRLGRRSLRTPYRVVP
jgi:hypothetical protein